MYRVLKSKVGAILHLNKLCEFRNSEAIHDAAAWWLDYEIAELEHDIVRGRGERNGASN